MIHFQVEYYNKITKNGKLYPHSYKTLKELYFSKIARYKAFILENV